jgi:hypothetical protein
MIDKAQATPQQPFFKVLDEKGRESFNFELWASAVKHQMLASLEKRSELRNKQN